MADNKNAIESTPTIRFGCYSSSPIIHIDVIDRGMTREVIITFDPTQLQEILLGGRQFDQLSGMVLQMIPGAGIRVSDATQYKVGIFRFVINLVALSLEELCAIVRNDADATIAKELFNQKVTELTAGAVDAICKEILKYRIVG